MSGTNLTIRAASVSGTTLTWGTAVTISAVTQYAWAGTSLSYDNTAGVWLLSYITASNTVAIRAVSVSGTTITLGTAVTAASLAYSAAPSSSYDSILNKHVITYNNGSSYPTAVVATVSGTTVTLGTPVVIESVSAFSVALGTGATQIYVKAKVTCTSFDTTSGKHLISYGTTAGFIKAVVGTVSGTAISFGTAVTTQLTYFSGTPCTGCGTTGPIGFSVMSWVDIDRSRMLITGQGYNSSSYILEYSWSGTTLTFVSITTQSLANSYVGEIRYDATNKQAYGRLNNSQIQRVWYPGGYSGGNYYLIPIAIKYNYAVSQYQIYGIGTNLVNLGALGAPDIYGSVCPLGTSGNAVMNYSYDDGLGVASIAYTTQAMTMPASNQNYGFGGFVDASYTNGQTANFSFALPGTILTTTGLTTGRNYYYTYGNVLTAVPIQTAAWGFSWNPAGNAQGLFNAILQVPNYQGTYPVSNNANPLIAKKRPIMPQKRIIGPA
jgi:hypothetical protein